MVKSGSFKVGQGSIFGRIGSGIGQGLAESIPKEMERGRLSQGLQQLSNESANLTPLQQYAKVASIPGITPQMIQALPEIIKQQNLRQAYARQAGGTAEEVGQQPMGSIGAGGRAPSTTAQQQISQAEKMVAPTERGQPQIVETNPLRESAVPRQAWNQQRFEQEISNILNSGKAQTVPEAIQLAKENEARYLGEPESVQKIDDYFRERQGELEGALSKKLSTLLEIDPKTNSFKNLTGEDINNLTRTANRELRTNPKATVEDIANKYGNIALDLDKTKNRLNVLAKQGIFDKLTNQDKTFDKLKSYQKIFAETNNQENYADNLKTNFGFSPMGADTIAYPISKTTDLYIDKWKPPSNLNLEKSAIESRKLATDIGKMIQPNDSILSIINKLLEKSYNPINPGVPAFNSYEFISQLREDQDDLGLTPRQKRQLAEGIGSGIPNWADILYLPRRK